MNISEELKKLMTRLPEKDLNMKLIANNMPVQYEQFFRAITDLSTSTVIDSVPMFSKAKALYEELYKEFTLRDYNIVRAAHINWERKVEPLNESLFRMEMTLNSLLSTQITLENTLKVTKEQIAEQKDELLKRKAELEKLMQEEPEDVEF